MGRWSRAVRRRTFCLWLLLLGFALFTLVLSDLFNRDRDHNPGSPSRPPYRIPSAPDLEVIVDSRDPALELDVDLPPLKSLQEDQLLFVSSLEGTKNLSQKKAAYKVLLPGANKDNRDVASAARGEVGKATRLYAEEAGKDAEPSSVQKYGFNEAVSEGISVHRRVPEARHPRQVRTPKRRNEEMGC